ncbi:MAG: hypothetical protein ABI868_16770 [Acidobacteriota bacterium]
MRYDGQRLLERGVERRNRTSSSSRPKQGTEDVSRGGQDAVPQRSGNGRCMLVRRLDDRLQPWAIAARRRNKCRGVQEPPERRAGALVVDRQVDVELEEASCIETAGIDQAQVGAVEDQRPGGGPPYRLGHRDAPMRIDAVRPRRYQQQDRLSAGPDRGNQDRIQTFDRRRSFEPQHLDERGGRCLQQRPDAGRRTDHAPGAAPSIQSSALDRPKSGRRLDRRVTVMPRLLRTARRGGPNRFGAGELALDEEPGDEMSRQAWQHGVTAGGSAAGAVSEW